MTTSRKRTLPSSSRGDRQKRANTTKTTTSSLAQRTRSKTAPKKQPAKSQSSRYPKRSSRRGNQQYVEGGEELADDAIEIGEDEDEEENSNEDSAVESESVGEEEESQEADEEESEDDEEGDEDGDDEDEEESEEEDGDDDELVDSEEDGEADEEGDEESVDDEEETVSARVRSKQGRSRNNRVSRDKSPERNGTIASNRPKRGAREATSEPNAKPQAKASQGTGKGKQSNRNSKIKAKVVSSLDVGAEVICKWSGNNEEYPARILKRRRSSQAHDETSDGKDSPDADEFYVRYLGFDHRLDEWVPRDRIREDSAFSTAPAALPSPSPSPSAYSGDEGEVHQVKNIHSIELGRYEVETWYYSPYPEEYCKENKLFLCEFCLKYMKKRHTLERHAEKCDLRHPPGTEIYREGELSVFEVDGKKQRIYCQNLCLLSKLFLDHKTLYYDVDPFYFYILTECDENGAHIVGYFSKEKYSPDGYNLACIMTLPPYQRKGYGSFLISLSYELSKKEGVLGSPEKPLSDLGRLGYRSYWSRVILSLLREHRGSDLSVKDIAKQTSIAVDDIVDTLKELKLVRFWKGKHVLVISQKLIDAYLDSTAGKKFRVVDPSKLTWTARRNGRGAANGESRQRS